MTNQKKTKTSKAKINFIIDVVLLILLFLIGSIGILIKYVLLSGQESWEKYHQKVELLLFGWDRHQWGTLHFILSAIFIALILLHIILHWSQVKCLFKLTIAPKTARIILTSLFLFICLLLLLLPFVLPIEINVVPTGQGRQHILESEKKKSGPEPQGMEQNHSPNQKHQPEIQGYMTLEDVAIQYGISADTLKKHLGIAQKVPNKSRLGHLRRQYHFKMSTIERLIQKKLNNPSSP
ncbi:DUF4405 domain-containing protein [candidate division KSB1 bacterium]|nr:DUF4405 domain-containing protein [candidate division KSB1 bacterium]